MTDFHDRDLTGARFHRTNLRRATFTDVHLNDAVLRDVDLSGADLRGVALRDVRMRGVELVGVDIHGEIRDVVINGVDVAPLIEAELNRRMPERVKMSPTDADGFRDGWNTLVGLWDTTIERARGFSGADLNRGVNDEWSFIQTLRHLNFAMAAWVDRMILGEPSPWHPLDLPWEEAPRWEEIVLDRDARPGLDEVLAVRQQRLATVGKVMADLTDEQLASTVTRTEPGWPKIEDFPFRECLVIVLIEGWEHRLYAERDLTIVESDR